MNRLKLWSALGTGKTSTLLKEIKKESELEGIENSTITTFRRDVADEIKFKVSVITKTNERELGNINTIHGICYNLLQRPKVITGKDLKDFGKKYGYETPSKIIDPSDPEDLTTEDMKTRLNFYSWMKNTCTSLSDYYLYPNLADQKDRHDFKQFYMEYEDFKNEIKKIDFSDMLIECYNQGLKPYTKALFIDEFQNLTRQQYQIVNTWTESMDNVIIAGDPLQSIYPFWGSSPDHLYAWDAEQLVLPISYRLSSDIWTATGDTLR